MTKKTIVIGCDHAGYELKTGLIEYLYSIGYTIKDIGAHSAEVSVDYPTFGNPTALMVNSNAKTHVGILVCGSGIGMSIVANRYPQVRAALVHSIFMAEMARKHNDANIIVFGQNVTPIAEAIPALNIFLNTTFEGGRHQRRVDAIGIDPDYFTNNKD